MATKNNQLLLLKQDYLNDFKDSGSQYSNLNLNQIFSNEPSFVQSKNKSSNNNNRFDDTVIDSCYKEKEKSWSKTTKGLCSKPLELLTLHDNNEGKKEAQKRWMNNSLQNASNSSTLSLHIAAYENAIEEDSNDKEEYETKKFKKTKNMMDFSSKFKNPFEIPRQMINHHEAFIPQVMQFKASHRLLKSTVDESQPLYNFTVDDPLAKCRHEPASFTSLEIMLMIAFQVLLFFIYFFGITYLWMSKVRSKAQYYLNALPDKRILRYMKQQQKAPFELQPPSK